MTELVSSSHMSFFLSFYPYPGILKKLRPFDIFLIFILLLVLSIQAFFSLLFISDFFSVTTPKRDGVLHEGMVGTPVYRNPLYASTTVEQDIASLLHAGLLRRDHAGSFIPHLASSWSVDATTGTYQFTLATQAQFHDGAPVSVEDVAFTLSLISELPEENRYRKMWKGVVVAVGGSHTFSLTVPEGNLSFPYALTTPILPHHVWQKVPEAQRATYTGSGVHIGAGPYRYEREAFTFDERPTRMTLSHFPHYVLGQPYLKQIVLHFFPTTEALLATPVEDALALHSVSASQVDALLESRDYARLTTAQSSRVFGLFFNTEDGRLLQDPLLRSILARSLPRDRIEALFATHTSALYGPLPYETIPLDQANLSPEELRQAFDDIGWEFEGSTGRREKEGVPLELSFVLPESAETQLLAEMIVQVWRELGVVVEVRLLPETLLSETIAEQQFDIILHGYIANDERDLVSLWQSGDQTNIASLTSFGTPTLNTLLTELSQVRAPERFLEEDVDSYDDKWRAMVYDAVKVELVKTVPAVFLYSPHFLYILPKDIAVDHTGEVLPQRIVTPSDRFSFVHLWHIGTERVWKVVNRE